MMETSSIQCGLLGFAYRRAKTGFLVAAAVLAGNAAISQELDDYPDGPAKDIIEQRCGICHTLRNVRSSDYSPEGWLETLVQMRNAGAALSDSELEIVANYLAVHSPQGPRPSAVIVPGDIEVRVREWQVPTPGTAPRDVAVSPDGALWYTGQFASMLIRVDLATGILTEHRTRRPYSGPMGIAVDNDGNVWFASSRRGYIGTMTPATGIFTDYPMPDGMPPDPSALTFDGSDTMWFTAQTGDVVGRIDSKSGDIEFIPMPTAKSRPYSIAVAPNGDVFVGLRDAKSIARIDPESLVITEYPLTGPETEPRRIAITDNGMVWYTDIDGGNLGRLDPDTGEVTEFASPSGPISEPHGITTVGNIVWYIEAATIPNALIRFDPEVQTFQSWPLSGFGVVRDLAATADGNLAFAMGMLNRVGLVEIENEGP